MCMVNYKVDHEAYERKTDSQRDPCEGSMETEFGIKLRI